MKAENPLLQRTAFSYLGVDITKGEANDTLAFWISQGPGYCTINTNGMLRGQPGIYGFLLNFCDSIYNHTHQLWLTMPTGSVYHRSCNSSSTLMPDIWNNIAIANGTDILYYGKTATKNLHPEASLTSNWGIKANAILTSSWGSISGLTSHINFIRK